MNFITDYHDGHSWITIECNGCGKTASVPTPCGNRFCTVCGVSRRFRIRRKIEFMCNTMRQLTGEKYHHLTLTIKSQQSIIEMSRFLVASFRRLRQTKYWKKRVSGGAYVIEFVPSSSMPGYWHAHLHILISNTFMDVDELRALWKKCSHGGTHVNLKLCSRNQVAGYLTKYATKAQNVPPERVEEVGIAMKGLRMFQPFGLWHGYCKEQPKLPAHCPTCGCGKWTVQTTEMAEMRESDERDKHRRVIRDLDRKRKEEEEYRKLYEKLDAYVRPD